MRHRAPRPLFRRPRSPHRCRRARRGGGLQPVTGHAGPRRGQHPPAVHYVALGDSYSSGVGAGSYVGSSGACDQSTSAYPALWDAANQPASYVSGACSGAAW